ncbi:hypothetical protein B0H14DRAFT_2957071, partial [Mycena olivaceomarginata]
MRTAPAALTSPSTKPTNQLAKKCTCICIFVPDYTVYTSLSLLLLHRLPYSWLFFLHGHDLAHLHTSLYAWYISLVSYILCRVLYIISLVSL